PVQTQPESIFQNTFTLQPLEEATGRISGFDFKGIKVIQLQRLLQRGVELPGNQAKRQRGEQHKAQQRKKQFTNHVPLDRSAIRFCSLRVSGPSGQTWLLSWRTGQMP